MVAGGTSNAMRQPSRHAPTEEEPPHVGSDVPPHSDGHMPHIPRVSEPNLKLHLPSAAWQFVWQAAALEEDAAIAQPMAHEGCWHALVNDFVVLFWPLQQ